MSPKHSCVGLVCSGLRSEYDSAPFNTRVIGIGCYPVLYELDFKKNAITYFDHKYEANVIGKEKGRKAMCLVIELSERIGSSHNEDHE